MQLKDELISAMLKEIELQKNYLDNEIINTIYFGGGTPSIFSPEEILSLIDQVKLYFGVNQDAEITLEANPDDLDDEYLLRLAKTPVNRLSIGCQSFIDRDLVFLNRRHTAQQAQDSVKRAIAAGFSNISVDLIYGIPNMSVSDLKKNIQKTVELNVQHISAYHLTIEEKTVFYKRKQKGQLKEISEKESSKQFQVLIQELADKEFEQYEISNFCRKGNYAVHNTNYWKQIKYLGIGPSAHSYNTSSRQWNINNNKAYITEIGKGKNSL